MKKAFFICVVILLSKASWAEKKTDYTDSTTLKKKVSYFFTFGMGAMIGCNACQSTGNVANFTTSSVHGIQIGKRLSLGAGVGFDSYENWKTMPIFGSASFDLFGRKNKIAYYCIRHEIIPEHTRLNGFALVNIQFFGIINIF